MFSSASNISLPRTVPGSLIRKIIFGQVQVMLGIIFTLVGFGVAYIFSLDVDFKSFSFKGNEPVAQGLVKTVDGTGVRINNRTVFSYSFAYTAADGIPRTGESFSSTHTEIDPGDTVVVEYLAKEPQTARIRDMRMAPMEIWVLAVLIFPMFGIFFGVIGIRKARRNIYLVRNGMFTKGEITGKQATNTSVNKQRVYKIFFRFTVNGVEYKSSSRTHHTYLVTDEKSEPLIYDPANPKDAVLVDVLPKAVRKFFESENPG